jgi:hypothetical protein
MTVGRAGAGRSIRVEGPALFYLGLSLYSGRGKFMPLPLKSKILETPGTLVTDKCFRYKFGR